MKAIVFPGEGSQRTGMGSDVFDQFPELVATADAVLGFSIRDLCLINAGGKLDKTVSTQPAIYVVSLLRYYAMIAQSAPPSFVAGHSVGEYAALTAAGVFDFATGLRIVQQRGLLMGEAFGGGLVAVLGLNAEGVKRLLAEAGISGWKSPTSTRLHRSWLVGAKIGSRALSKLAPPGPSAPYRYA